jgi:hypothetical protein
MRAPAAADSRLAVVTLSCATDCSRLLDRDLAAAALTRQ